MQDVKLCPICKIKPKINANNISVCIFRDELHKTWHEYIVYDNANENFNYKKILNNFASVSISVYLHQNKSTISFNDNEPFSRINLKFDFRVSLDDFDYDKFVEKIKTYQLLK